MRGGLFLKSTLNWYLNRAQSCLAKNASISWITLCLLNKATFNIKKKKCHRIIMLLCVFTTLFCQITATLCKLFRWNTTGVAFVKYYAWWNWFSYCGAMQDFTLFDTKYSVNVEWEVHCGCSACAQSVHTAGAPHRPENYWYTRPSVRKQRADLDPKGHQGQKGQQ